LALFSTVAYLSFGGGIESAVRVGCRASSDCTLSDGEATATDRRLVSMTTGELFAGGPVQCEGLNSRWLDVLDNYHLPTKYYVWFASSPLEPQARRRVRYCVAF